MHDKVTLKILRELSQKLVQMTERAGFSSITEFIVFAMRNMASSGAISGGPG